jgi:hypothetical protein
MHLQRFAPRLTREKHGFAEATGLVTFAVQSEPGR